MMHYMSKVEREGSIHEYMNKCSKQGYDFVGMYPVGGHRAIVVMGKDVEKMPRSVKVDEEMGQDEDMPME